MWTWSWAPSGPAWAGGVGWGDFQRSLPTLGILWSCEMLKKIKKLFTKVRSYFETKSDITFKMSLEEPRNASLKQTEARYSHDTLLQLSILHWERPGSVQSSRTNWKLDHFLRCFSLLRLLAWLRTVYKHVSSHGIFKEKGKSKSSPNSRPLWKHIVYLFHN